MKAIRTYETKEEYLNDLENFLIPSIQYVKETDESTIRKNSPFYEKLTVYLDDFPEDYMQEYDIQRYDIDPEGEGVWKIFVYEGDTIEIDGKTFYLWKSNRFFPYSEDKDDTWTFLLTSSVDYNELYSQSIVGHYYDTSHTDFSLPFDSFVAITRNQKDYILRNEGSDNDVRLVKIVREASRRMWVDNFPPGITEDSFTFEDFITRPDDCRVNGYEFTGNIIEYGGNVQYVWESIDTHGFRLNHYLLTSTIDYETLQSQSLKYNYEQTGVEDTEIPFDAFIGFLSENNDYYQQLIENTPTRLVIIE